MTETDLIKRKKVLKYRANHRGIKEMDIVLGTYADKYLDGMDKAGLDQFEELINIPDQDFFRYLTNQEDIPEEYNNDIMKTIKSFRFTPGFYTGEGDVTFSENDQ